MSLNLSTSAKGKVKKEHHDDAEIRALITNIAKNSLKQLQQQITVFSHILNLPGDQSNTMNYVIRRNNVMRLLGWCESPRKN